MDIDLVKKIIQETPCPWNPNQTPQWHLEMWRSSLMWEVNQAEKLERK